MKLTYRDKVILGIVLAIAILLAGYFALVKPKTQEIKDNKDTLSERQKVEKDYKSKIAQIDPLKQTISDTVDETAKITDHFIDMDKISNPVLLDKFMQHFANDFNLKITSLSAGDMGETNLSYYYIKAPNPIGSGLRDLADVNGEYKAADDAKQAEQNQLSKRATGSVLRTQYGVSVEGTKKDLWAFMDEINKYKETMLIDSVSFSVKKDDEKKKDDTENKSEEEKKNEEESKFKEDEEKLLKDDDNLSINLVLSLYSVYELPQPKIETIE
jgi:hypothetical protein